MDFLGEDSISIPEYFANQSIFVTGGTGFVGKVLIEKVLRSCPDVANIYVLIRPKKDVTIEQRWSKITESPIFEKLQLEQPEALKKVVLLQGDLREQGLGLSDNLVQLLAKNVTIVYHSAAMIQFTDSICDAYYQNVMGTREILELAKFMTKLKAFVYVSSAYSNSNRPPEQIEEEILPACQDWKVVGKMIKNGLLQIEALREKLLCGHPNPYTWSKSLAEQVVDEYKYNFPTIIMRPAIITAALEEPLAGWGETPNGFIAYCMLGFYGILSVTPSQIDRNMDIVPVDYTIKACLIAPWRRHITLKHSTNGIRESQRTEVYNCAFGKNLIVNYADIMEITQDIIENNPSDKMVWVRNISYVSNKTLFHILFLIYQVIPAVIADVILNAIGKPIRAVKLMKKIPNMMRLTGNLMKIYTIFPNDGFSDLGKKLKEKDKPAFAYDLNAVKKEEFLHCVITGFRRYFMKEDLSEEAIKRNIKRMKRIKLLHKVVTLLKYLVVAYILMRLIDLK